MMLPVRGCGSAPDGCCSGGRVSPHGRLEVLGGHPGLDQHDPATVVHGVHHAAEPPADALRPRRREEDPRRKLPLTPYPPLSFASHKGVLHRHFVDFDAFLAELVLDRIARLDTQAAARFCWPPEPPPAP